MALNAKYFVEKYELQQHPEGGWFKETYRSDEGIQQEHLPGRFSGGRSFCTAIYFLLEGVQFSSFHRIQSDELWHFYAGEALHIFVINQQGGLQIIKLNGQQLKNLPAAARAPRAAGNEFAVPRCKLSGKDINPGKQFTV